MAVETRNWSFAPGSIPDPNSCGISYAAGDVIHDAAASDTPAVGTVARAVHDFLVTHGWSKFTLLSGAVAGKYFYNAPNLPDHLGTPSLKWMMLDFSQSGKLVVNCAELYSTAGVATNAANNASVIGLAMSTKDGSNLAATSGKIWLGATARHAVFHAYSNGVYGAKEGNSTNYFTIDYGPVGVFEATRQPFSWDAVATGLCKFGVVATGSLFGAATIQPFISPKTRRGAGTFAYNRAATLFGAGGIGVLETAASTPAPMIMPKSPMVDASVAASNIIVHDVTINGGVNGLVGHICNCIALQGQLGAGIGDDIQIPVSADANFGNHKFFDPAGSLESYWVLGSVGIGLSQAAANGRIAIPK